MAKAAGAYKNVRPVKNLREKKECSFTPLLKETPKAVSVLYIKFNDDIKLKGVEVLNIPQFSKQAQYVTILNDLVMPPEKVHVVSSENMNDVNIKIMVGARKFKKIMELFGGHDCMAPKNINFEMALTNNTWVKAHGFFSSFSTSFEENVIDLNFTPNYFDVIV